MLLRALTGEDEGEFLRVLDVSRTAWEPWTPARASTVTDADTFRIEMERTVRGAAAGTHLRLAAFLDNGRLAGLFGLNEIVRGVFQSAYAAWMVSADAMDRGLGSEGVQALLDLAFEDEPHGLGLHRVQANVMPSNAASLRVAEKAGFRREGLAERYLEISGRWEDHVMFAVTAEERAHGP